MPATKDQITFSNENIRVLANEFARTYFRGKIALERWDALGYEDAFPNDAEILDDGSEQDGRTRITGADVHGMMAVVKVLDALNAQHGWLGQVLKISTNPY